MNQNEIRAFFLLEKQASLIYARLLKIYSHSPQAAGLDLYA
jgi:hypothetical protein